MIPKLVYFLRFDQFCGEGHYNRTTTISSKVVSLPVDHLGLLRVGVGRLNAHHHGQSIFGLRIGSQSVECSTPVANDLSDQELTIFQKHCTRSKRLLESRLSTGASTLNV
jgi:hypothetical protein